MSYTREITNDDPEHTARPKLEKALERIATTTGLTRARLRARRSDVKSQSLVFGEVRKKTLPFAEAQGLVTDEDVFRALS